jgi:hypothetical protein
MVSLLISLEVVYFQANGKLRGFTLHSSMCINMEGHVISLSSKC